MASARFSAGASPSPAEGGPARATPTAGRAGRAITSRWRGGASTPRPGSSRRSPPPPPPPAPRPPAAGGAAGPVRGCGPPRRHDLVVAHREQLPPGGIERQPGGLLATTDGPHRDDAELSRIDHREAALVLEVHVDAALAVRDRKLGFGIQRDGADDGVGPGIDGGGVAAAPVEREHALAGGIGADGVGGLPRGLDRLEPRGRLQIYIPDVARAPCARLPDDK